MPPPISGGGIIALCSAIHSSPYINQTLPQIIKHPALCPVHSFLCLSLTEVRAVRRPQIRLDECITVGLSIASLQTQSKTAVYDVLKWLGETCQVLSQHMYLAFWMVSAVGRPAFLAECHCNHLSECGAHFGLQLPSLPLWCFMLLTAYSVMYESPLCPVLSKNLASRTTSFKMYGINTAPNR